MLLIIDCIDYKWSFLPLGVLCIDYKADFLPPGMLCIDYKAHHRLHPFPYTLYIYAREGLESQAGKNIFFIGSMVIVEDRDSKVFTQVDSNTSSMNAVIIRRISPIVDLHI